MPSDPIATRGRTTRDGMLNLSVNVGVADTDVAVVLHVTPLARAGELDENGYPKGYFDRVPGSIPEMINSSQDEPVQTHLGKSVFALLVMPPVGLVALVFSIMAEASKSHDPVRARSYGTQAANWGIAALALLLAMMFGGLLFVIAFRNSGFM